MKCLTRNVSLAAAVLALVLSGGCQKKEQVDKKDGEEGGVKTLRIGLIAKSTNNPVFMAALDGAKTKAAELNKEYDGKVKVEIDWQTPPEEDADKQASSIRQLVNSGVDAIIVSCSDATTLMDAINEAVDKGVPVMCFDSDAPASKRFAFYGVDDKKTGALVMDTLAEQMDGKGLVAVLAGNQNAPNLRKRVEGLKEAKENYPDITLDQVYYHDEIPEKAAEKVIQAQQNKPQIQGWAMVGGWPLFTDALTDWPDKYPDVKIVAVDALPAQLQYVQNGLCPVLLAQKCWHWGYESVDMTFRKIYEEEDVQTKIMELVPVAKGNLVEWAKTLKSQGFVVPDKYLQE